MAIFKNNPPIVTNGLVLYLDAANRQSYRSGSNSWNNLTANPNITGSVNPNNFNFNFGGSFEQRVAANIITLSNTITINTGSEATLRYLIRSYVTASFTGFNTNHLGLFDDSNFDGQNSGFFEGQNRFIAYNNNPTLQGFAFMFPIVPPLNLTQQFVDLTLVFTSGSLIMYNNGVRCTPTSSLTGELQFNKIAGARITDYSSSLSIFSYYNRALTPQEITQNYNATKARFNLT